MLDGRVYLIFFLAFLYLSQAMLSAIPGLLTRPAGTAKLESLPSDRLVLEEERVLAGNSTENNVVANHAPFLFQPIPVNTADKETLMTVKGIGPVLAEAIIIHRQHSGHLYNISDLKSVPGLGAKRAASLAPFLVFDGIR